MVGLETGLSELRRRHGCDCMREIERGTSDQWMISLLGVPAPKAFVCASQGAVLDDRRGWRLLRAQKVCAGCQRNVPERAQCRRGGPGAETGTPEGAHRDLTSDRGHGQRGTGGARG